MRLGLIQSIPSAVVGLDPDGRITALNSAAEMLLSTSTEQAVGALYPTVFGSSLSAKMIGLFQRTARSGTSGGPQLLVATLPDGRRTTLRASLGQTFDEEGNAVGTLFVADQQPDGSSAPDRAEDDPSVERLRGALRRYVGDAVAGMVEARPSFVGVGGTRREVSILHTDVRGYTTVAEQMEPEQLLTLLSRYHGAATAAIQAHGGTIDRFIGDAILALWNAPQPQEQHARQAIRGALAMRDATLQAGSELAYGVGVHRGEVVVGNLGSDQYMNFTAIGDAVNVAARLQAAAAGGEVVCSAAALEVAGPGIRVAPMGELALKGRTAPVTAYKVEGIDE